MQSSPLQGPGGERKTPENVQGTSEAGKLAEPKKHILDTSVCTSTSPLLLTCLK